MRSLQLLILVCLMLGCESKNKNSQDGMSYPKLAQLPKDPFSSKFLFDSHQNLLKLNINELSKFQADSLLKNLHVEDQKYRIEINEIKRSGSVDQAEKREIYSKMQKADEINYTLLMRIHEKFGWPSNKVFSDSAVDASFLITLHYQGYKLEYLTPIIEESFSRNEIRNDYYAILTDRVLLRKGNSQKFGTHCRKNRDGSVDFISLPDTTGINRNRKEIGLGSLDWTTCDLVKY